MSTTATETRTAEDVAAEYLEEKYVTPMERRAIAIMNADLYHGPYYCDHAKPYNRETFEDFETWPYGEDMDAEKLGDTFTHPDIQRTVRALIDNLPSTVYVDNDTDSVSERTPPETCQDAGLPVDERCETCRDYANGEDVAEDATCGFYGPYSGREIWRIDDAPALVLGRELWRTL